MNTHIMTFEDGCKIMRDVYFKLGGVHSMNLEHVAYKPGKGRWLRLVIMLEKKTSRVEDFENKLKDQLKKFPVHHSVTRTDTAKFTKFIVPGRLVLNQ